MRSKADYEAYLDAMFPPYESDSWIIGGKNRNYLYPNYGKAIRKYDPIAFEVGYRDYKGFTT